MEDVVLIRLQVGAVSRFMILFPISLFHRSSFFPFLLLLVYAPASDALTDCFLSARWGINRATYAFP